MRRRERVNSKTTGCKCCMYFSKRDPRYRRYLSKQVRSFYKKEIKSQYGAGA